MRASQKTRKSESKELILHVGLRFGKRVNGKVRTSPLEVRLKSLNDGLFKSWVQSAI